MNDSFKKMALQLYYERTYLHKTGSFRLSLLNFADLFITVVAFLVAALLLNKDYTISVLLLIATVVVKIEHNRVLSAYDSFSAYRKFRKGRLFRVFFGIFLLLVVLLAYAVCYKNNWIQSELFTIPFVFLVLIYVFIAVIENSFNPLKLPS